MRYFIDSEFIEDGKTIELISIGIKAEDGREYFAVSNEFNPVDASEWVVENVLPHLPAMGSVITLEGFNGIITKDYAWKSRLQISEDILDFIGSDRNPEFWAYFADYDWIIVCQLFGTMMDLPEHFPKYCRDIKQLADELNLYPIPIPDATPLHDALADARWALNAWRFLATHKFDLNRKFINELRPELGNFAHAMELILSNNDQKGGWHDLSLSTLNDCIKKEYASLGEALNSSRYEEAQKQAIDIANYSMMLFNNIEAVKYHASPNGEKSKTVLNQV